MKLYFEKNNSKTAYKPVGQYKKIYFNGRGEPYFMHNGRREKFDNIPRLTYPILPEDEQGKLIVIGGYIPVTNCFSLLVELHPDGEMVRLWEEIEIDE